MRGCLASLVFALVVGLTPMAADVSIGESQAKSAALEFGRALVRAEVSLITPILPARGKVRLKLSLLGPEEGAYSPGQVEAVLKDFFRQGNVRSYDLLRLECAEDQYALAHARARIVDRDGRHAEIELDLTFQPEEGHWVLREIRETPS